MGSYAFEPPGDIHTLEIPDDVDEMATLFHVTGAIGVEDVFTKIENAGAHYERVGLGATYIEQFIR